MLYVNIHFDVFYSIYFVIQINEESFNNGNVICYICKFPTLPHDDAPCHEACFYVDCLNNMGTGWLET